MFYVFENRMIVVLLSNGACYSPITTIAFFFGMFGSGSFSFLFCFEIAPETRS